jgi:predicted metalloprotease with PDZ domain
MKMLKTFLVTILFSFLAVNIFAEEKPRSLKISVRPVEQGRFTLIITFRGDEDGSTTLNLPNEWGGQSNLFNAVQNLSAKNANITETDKPHVKTLIHQPGGTIEITYEIRQDYDGAFRNAVRYRPAATSEFIHWIGNTVFVLPAWDDSASVKAEIEWSGFPKSWSIANSFGVNTRKQRFEAPFGEIVSGLFVAGDFRVSKTLAAGEPVYVVVRGKWQFEDAQLAIMVSRVIESQRNFWNDHSQKRYLVSLVPMDEGPNFSSFGGTGLTDSFALFATSNATVGGIRGLLSHEYSHNWIPSKMGRMPDPEQSLYWFSEGFNEFYNYRQLLRGGIITRKEFIDAYNQNIREYFMSPVREVPNERIVNHFWNNQQVQRLPYLRGLLFATNLNAAIERASQGKRSLDDAMFELYKAASMSKNAKLSFEYLAEVFRRRLDHDPTPMMTRHLLDGVIIDPAPDALGKDVVLENVELDVFELGFDFDRFAKERVVAGVKPNSAAYAAGLRDGQQRNGGVSISFGDTTREIELKVKDDNETKIVKFLPVAKERLKVPQFRFR